MRHLQEPDEREPSTSEGERDRESAGVGSLEGDDIRDMEALRATTEADRSAGRERKGYWPGAPFLELPPA